MVTKVCKICNKPFETESPNKQYCSEKCSKRAAKKAYRSRKMKHIMSKDYNLDKEIAQLNNRAHTLSRDLAKMFIPYKCASSEEGHICEDDLECHHINHDPFDCRISNLQWLCKKAHAQIHSKEHDCDIVAELKAYKTIKDQYDIRELNRKSQSEVKHDHQSS